jgi:uncharacterized protein (UPF0548 family)
VLSLRKPSVDALRRFRADQSQLDFTYAAVGATFGSGPMPTGFAVDQASAQLGMGGEAFDKSKAALRRWRQFQLGWLEAWPADTPLCAGETVVVVARTPPVWWMNAARIVYIVDDATDSTSRFGFAYGTLPGHVETGTFSCGMGSCDRQRLVRYSGVLAAAPFLDQSGPPPGPTDAAALSRRIDRGDAGGRETIANAASVTFRFTPARA